MKKKVVVSVIGLIGLVTIAFGCGASNAKAKGENTVQNLTEADYWGLRVTSLTPRLNSDGTVMVDKENKK